MPRRAWTAEELASLEEMYGGVRVDEIARHLNRTVAAIHNRAGKMHLGRNRPAGVMSLHEFMGVLGIDSHATVRRWIRERMLIAVRKPSTYGRATRPEWWIRDQDVATFLSQHPHQIDRDRIDLAYRQYVPERWITLVEAFKRGAAWPQLLESSVKAGLVPEALKRGDHGTRWAIPERILPALIAARKRMTTDAEHRRLVLMYGRAERRGTLHRRGSRMTTEARRASDGGRSGRGRVAA